MTQCLYCSVYVMLYGSNVDYSAVVLFMDYAWVCGRSSGLF